MTILVTMKTASVSELKAHLSKYLREVLRGGEIQVLDRGVPIARLVPLAGAGAGIDKAHRQSLIGAGILRPGSGKVAAILKAPPLKLPVSLGAALDEERGDRV
jgi:prevent-host-death family protein